MRQCAWISVTLLFVSAIAEISGLPPTRKNNLRVPNSLSTNQRDEQWQIERALVDKGDWDEDDDDLPFHVQDDDATNNISNQAPSMEENESETYLERYNDGLNENSAKIKEESIKKEKGIVYTDSAGDKESEEEHDAPVPPPPPPLPSTEKSIANEDEEQEQESNADVIKEKNTEEEEIDFVQSKAEETNATSSKQGSKHNNKHNSKQSPAHVEPKSADTIFDDLLRGFTFAATFCALIMCIYKFCGYACVKIGICPDERVMRARWRRSRLKKKRAYGDSNVVPPLDTRKWAEWSAKRGRVNGGVWDSGFDDIENNVGSHDEDGAIVFDNSGIEMAEWENESEASEMELEFGEGDELEDKSHDERLFDADDDGKGVEREADRFFENQSKKNVSVSKAQTTKKKDADKSESKSKSPVDQTMAENDGPLLFNASFDALDPPSGENNVPGSNSNSDQAKDSSAAKEFLLEESKHSEDLNLNADSNDDQNGDVENSFRSDDDRGYDEDEDLLGLRSDSPPPLDLEEIEKNLVENMNNAKFY